MSNSVIISVSSALPNVYGFTLIGPVYTKGHCQCSINAMMIPATLFPLKSMELLENGVATHFVATPLLEMNKNMKNTLGAT